MITDKLGSYAAARRRIMPAIEHRSHKGLNNRAENSHLPLRRRERAMQGFRSPGGLQRFVAVFSAVRNLFVPPVPVAPPWPPIFIASTPWRNGRPGPASPPEPVRAAEIASPRALVS
jgi:putative transposase